MKIIFAGTPDFSVYALRSLIDSRHDIIAVYTRPDRPAGRGRKVKVSPVKQCALDHGIPVYQPESLKEQSVRQELARLGPDTMVVVAYGLILPEEILEIPRLGCLNIHASLLPRWRGAAPVQRAILAGDRSSGITVMQMDKGLDTGDMLLRLECDIHPDESAGVLHDRLAGLGARGIIEVIDRLETGTLQAVRQDNDKACYAAKLDKAEASLDWGKRARELDRQVHAFNPWPVAQTRWKDRVIRVWESVCLDGDSDKKPGDVIRAGKQGIDVITGDGILRLTTIQLPGGKPMSAQAFCNAHSIEDDTLS